MIIEFLFIENKFYKKHRSKISISKDLQKKKKKKKKKKQKKQKKKKEQDANFSEEL